jgi:hypothetical protein
MVAANAPGAETAARVPVLSMIGAACSARPRSADPEHQRTALQPSQELRLRGGWAQADYRTRR